MEDRSKPRGTLEGIREGHQSMEEGKSFKKCNRPRECEFHSGPDERMNPDPKNSAFSDIIISPIRALNAEHAG